MDISSTTISLVELIPSVLALVGIGISWGSLTSKIENERGRTDEVIKRIEDKISSLSEKREEIDRRIDDRIKTMNERQLADRASLLEEIKKIEVKIDMICEKVASINVCRGIDCVYRLEYERNVGNMRHVNSSDIHKVKG